ncbi:MAG: argininosuccinate lyase [Flavobacteriia bacterium]|nr:argininosuccinate lyase [Flavobacteriia bacterium]
MKLWDKGLKINQLIENFTIGTDREMDLHLAKYDVLVNKAHAKMLNQINLISADELNLLLHELDQIQLQIENNEFLIDDQFEDVHSKIEFVLTQKIGEAGKKIHTARSRNDQVLTDIHLYVKEEVTTIKSLVKELFDTLISKAELNKNVLLPGYTHLQIAMPSSFGLWFSAYAETLIDDVIMLNTVFEIADQNPLGSAAGYGASFPIDRSFTTAELGFKTLKYNVISAQMSRGKLEKTVSFALASIAGTLSKFCMDACLYMSQNFAFISLPDELTTGSSIMPHKKNPDVFELLRSTFNQIQSFPMEMILMTNNLTSGYHRDFQLLKESLIKNIVQTKNGISILNFMIENIQVNTEIINDEKYKYIFSVEEVNKLVMNGTPFRDAYKIIGSQIEANSFEYGTTVNHTHEGSIGNLCLNEIQLKMERY